MSVLLIPKPSFGTQRGKPFNAGPFRADDLMKKFVREVGQSAGHREDVGRSLREKSSWRCKNENEQTVGFMRVSKEKIKERMDLWPWSGDFIL